MRGRRNKEQGRGRKSQEITGRRRADLYVLARISMGQQWMPQESWVTVKDKRGHQALGGMWQGGVELQFT